MPRRVSARGRPRAVHLGDSEVDDLGLRLPGLTREEDVLGLEIAVDDAALVCGRERIGDGQERLHGLHRADAPPRRDRFRERLARKELHHDERIALARTAEIEHTNDGAVTETGRGARLLDETLVGLLRFHFRADELERDLGFEIEVLRKPHAAHATLAQLPDELVLAGDDLPRRVVARGERRAASGR